MKKLLSLIPLLVLASPLVASAAICQSYTSGTLAAITSFGYGADSSAVAQQFTAAQTCTITAVGVWVANDGSSPGTGQNVALSIYSDSGGKPGSSLASGSAISHSTFPTQPSFSQGTSTITYTITAGTKYWIVLEGTAPSTSSYFQNGGDTSTGSANGHRSFGGAWTVPFGTWTQWYEIDGTVVGPSFQIWSLSFSSATDTLRIIAAGIRQLTSTRYN